MSDSIAHKAWLVKETTFGAPVANPPMKAIRNIGCTLGLSKEGFESEEARADRAVSDFRHGNKAVGGDISIEFSYDSFDDLLEGVFCGADWAEKSPNVTSTDFEVTAVNKFVKGDNMPEMEQGEEFEIAGFTSAANNGRFRLVSQNGDEITVVKVDGSAPGLVVEAAGDSVTLTTLAQIIKTGPTRRSYNILRQFTDQSGGDLPYHLFVGCMVNAFNLTIAPGGNVKGSFTILGKDLSLASTAPSGSVLDAPGVTRVFDSFTGFMYEGGSLMALVTEIQFKIENGFESQYNCFSDVTDDPSIGKSRVSGQIGVRFKNAAMLQKFLNEEPSSLVFSLRDKDGSSYTFRLPRIVYTGGQPDTAAQGSIILTMPFVALYDEALDSQCALERVPGASI